MHKWDLQKLQKQQWNVVTAQLGAHLLYDRPQNGHSKDIQYECGGGQKGMSCWKWQQHS